MGVRSIAYLSGNKLPVFREINCLLMQPIWPWWRLLLFRFFFIYFLFSISPWGYLSFIPGINFIPTYMDQGLEWLAVQLSLLFFGTSPLIQASNGSGDTSMGWALLYSILVLSLVGALVWTLVQLRKRAHPALQYWLMLAVRYFIIAICFSYGIIKLFGMQMPFPNYSQLATPLGDFLPMRLSWMFIGYSAPYQFFSGLMEVFAGTMLLWRRTATLGAMLALGVFVNVAVLNLSYDIPVKIFSLQMVFACIFLLAHEWNRILCFFILNKPACACSVYDRRFILKRSRLGRWVLKGAFMVLVIGYTFYESYDQHQSYAQRFRNMPLPAGMWTVTQFVRNGDTVAPMLTDTLRWQNLVFDDNNAGSIATTDTVFRRRYSRAYFIYKTDTAQRQMRWFKRQSDTTAMAVLRYQFDNPETVSFRGNFRNDSIYFVLAKSNHHFQLAEKQFHWLSEANR